MKQLITTIIAAVFFTAALGAQSPQKMSYQAIIRNSEDQLVTSQDIGMQISILQGSIYGSSVYVETHTPPTNANGLVSIEIGEGTVVYGNFSGIDWSAGPYFIKTETDPSGGTNYTITGTSQLLSVPYALHSRTTDILEGDITESQISDLQGYLTSESDPLFNVSPANTITAGDVSDWKTAYSWGNHASASYVPETRTLSINGTTHDLSENGSWNVGTVTSVGLSLPNIFSVSGSPVTTSGTLSASLLNQTANRVFASPNIFNGPPSFRSLMTGDIPNLPWSKITSGKPTTLAGYGITDAVKKNSVGDFAQGGIVFWVDETGQHGLVCAKQDHDSYVKYSEDYTHIAANGDGPFSGEMNTTLILANLGPGGTYAALICIRLQITENGKTYGDWYLPSKSELNLMYQNKAVINATAIANGGGTFANEYYWSSTDGGWHHAWGQNFLNGVQISDDKTSLSYVRAVRAF